MRFSDCLFCLFVCLFVLSLGRDFGRCSDATPGDVDVLDDDVDGPDDARGAVGQRRRAFLLFVSAESP